MTTIETEEVMYEELKNEVPEGKGDATSITDLNKQIQRKQIKQ